MKGMRDPELFDILVRPLSNDLPGVAELTVVSDRELSRLPFAALWDREAQRYVVEGYRVRTEPSARFFDAARGTARASVDRRKALVVGNPALDAASLLQPLPGAEVEAKRVASLYRISTLLTRQAARRDSVLTLLRTSNVFHFAGHAIFSGDRPELSFLAFAPPRVGLQPGRSRHEKSRTATFQSGAGRAVGVSDPQLSKQPYRWRRWSRCELSSRGAPAIVSTLWDVSDDVTEPLLTMFHKHYAAGVPAADAFGRRSSKCCNRASGQQRGSGDLGSIHLYRSLRSA